MNFNQKNGYLEKGNANILFILIMIAFIFFIISFVNVSTKINYQSKRSTSNFKIDGTVVMKDSVDGANNKGIVPKEQIKPEPEYLNSFEAYNDEIFNLEGQRRELSLALRKELEQITRLSSDITNSKLINNASKQEKYAKSQENASLITQELSLINDKIAEAKRYQTIVLERNKEYSNKRKADMTAKTEKTKQENLGAKSSDEKLALLASQEKELNSKNDKLLEEYSQKLIEFKNLESKIAQNQQTIAAQSKVIAEQQKTITVTKNDNNKKDFFAPPQNIPKEDWSGITALLKK